MAKEAHSAIAVFTEVPAADIIAAGGSGDWVLNPEKASHQKYLVCCRKTRWNNMAEGVPHRAAFLVGVIKNLVPRGPTNRRGQQRYFVEVSQVAQIKKLDTWGRWQNPVIYTSLEKLGIDFGSIKFKPVSSAALEKPNPAVVPERLTIAQAKKALAATFGVEPENIEIIVRS